MYNYKATFTLLLDTQLNRELYKKLYKAFLDFKEINGDIVNYHENLVVADIKQNAGYSKTYAIITLTNKSIQNKEKILKNFLNCIGYD